MKHIKLFENFLNEAETSGPYYFQVNLRQSSLGGHSIDAEVASSGTQDFADIRDKSGFLKTPALDKELRELTLWKRGDKSGKLDTSFIREFEKRMQDIGFKLAKFKYSSPLVKQVADEAGAISAIKETIKTLDALYDSYTPELIPVQPGPAVSVKAFVDNLVNSHVSGRSDVVREITSFIESAVGSKVTRYIKHGSDDNTAIEKVGEQYGKEKPTKEETWGVLKACTYKEGIAIIWIEDPKKTSTPEYLSDYSEKNLKYDDLKPGDVALVVKK
jgi:hypothetical protein